MVFIILSLSACAWKASQKPSVLIIAVEQLNSEVFFCQETDAEFSEGLGALCHDGVRYTHAYTSSTMSQAALASLFTAKYPRENGVWHNGAQYLSEKFETVPEVAVKTGYHTSFFSGGPPIWSKSGLDQGFEVFDDNISISTRGIYRAAEKNFDLFLNWRNEITDGRPFFSTIYLADLQFAQTVTTSDLGQERAKGFDGQLHEINESLSKLVLKMKQQGIWDNTCIIFVGLNGSATVTRVGEISSVNLRSEETQVLLMIKPPRKARDIGLAWTIDSNVSLLDVGAMLYELLGHVDNTSSTINKLPVFSLKNSIDKPQGDWGRSRYVLSESAWANWRNLGSTRVALRQNYMLFIYDKKPQLFNALIDRFETQAIANIQGPNLQIVNDMTQFLASEGEMPWEGLPLGLPEKINLYRDMALLTKTTADIKIGLEHLVNHRPWDKQLIGLIARLAVEGKDWELLERLGTENFYPLWVYIAKRKRGEQDARPPDNSCWQWLDEKISRSNNTDTCLDTEFIALGEWINSKDSQRRVIAEEKFLRLFIYAELDEYIAASNYMNSLVWDTDVSIPAEPRFVQLAFELPEYKYYKNIAENRLKRQ
ncbi:MAG: hypothetical protein A2Z20_03870 [Bdellovibrionales bacterium RBG_16_40_8]|nr:MAG: hypothetical protein A2Z20_03870 [Bdellovibrionales bacterium RBG_16_40_8]